MLSDDEAPEWANVGQRFQKADTDTHWHSMGAIHDLQAPGPRDRGDE